MSKFSEKLANLGQSAPARMGFGAVSAREKTPVMLVIGRAKDLKSNSSSVDAVITPVSADGPAKDAGEVFWGITVTSGDTIDTKKLKEAGCAFMLIESDEISASSLLEEEISKGLIVEPDLPDQRIRAIEDGPFEFLVYRPDSLSLPLTVKGMIQLQELVSSFSKHIFLELSDIPNDSDLDVLKQLPVSAIIVDLQSAAGEKAKGLKDSISKLEPRKQKSERSPLVPLSGRNAVESDADSGDFDDEEEWEDED